MRSNLQSLALVATLTLGFGMSGAWAASKAVAVMPGKPDAVTATLIEEMTDRQYTLTAKDDHTLQFDRPVDNVALYPKLGGTPGHLPRARVTMTLEEVSRGTRVSARTVIITRPGTAEERVVDLGTIDSGLDRVLAGAEDTLVADSRRQAQNLAMADSSHR